jgi:hypothetical protein
MTPNQSPYPALPRFTADRQSAPTSWPASPQGGDARFNKPEFVGVTHDTAPSVTPSSWPRIFPGL